VTEAALVALPIVEDLDALEQYVCASALVLMGTRSTADPGDLDLSRGPEGLHRCVVAGIAGRAEGELHVVVAGEDASAANPKSKEVSIDPFSAWWITSAGLPVR
jgi:hypothetical protein